MLLGVISAPRSSEAAWDLLRRDRSQTQPRHESGVLGVTGLSLLRAAPFQASLGWGCRGSFPSL